LMHARNAKRILGLSLLLAITDEISGEIILFRN
jgi:hypothetical protein